MTRGLTRIYDLAAGRAVMCAALVALASCSQTDATIRLTVHYEDSWPLTDLEIDLADEVRQAPLKREFLLLVPKAWVDEEMGLAVTGRRGDDTWASGTTSVTPRAGDEVLASVVLERLPCGVWCTEGATECSNDGVVTCVIDEDGCLGWSEVTPCPAETPACSLGVCATACVDECVADEVRCVGPSATSVCGDGDSDTCREWLSAEECPSGEACSAGVCVGECEDQCAEGERDCSGGAIVECGDQNLDGCTEWSGAIPCDEGASCEDGACVSITECEDTCSGPVCDELSFRECGNFDLDPCAELSTGISCDAEDPCFEGSCSSAGCMSVERSCSDPPDALCIDDQILRTFDAAGTCVMGACEYPESDHDCASECVFGECSDTCTPSGWSTATVDSSGDVGENTSLAVDDDGIVYVTYTDVTRNGLRYASRSEGDNWTFEMVDTGFVAADSSVALDLNGRVHVAYYDDTHDDLRYAIRSLDGEWSPSTVDTEGDVGEHASLRIDSAGGAHISYRDATRADLKYAYRASSTTSWTLTTVDSLGDVGRFSSLALDTSNGAHVSYRESALNDVKYAYKPAGGSWTTSNVATEGDLGRYTSLRVGSSGVLHLTYYDATHEDLIYATRPTGGSWSFTTVDWVGDVGRDSSLAIDSAGSLHVSYRDSTNSDLKHATLPVGATWTLATVDADGSLGLDGSLTVDSTGRLHVSYRDSLNDDLKYATRQMCP